MLKKKIKTMIYLNKFKRFTINESVVSDVIDYFMDYHNIDFENKSDYSLKVNFITDVLDVFQSTIDEYDFYFGEFDVMDIKNLTYRIWIDDDSINKFFYLNFYFNKDNFKDILKSLEDDCSRLKRMGYKFDKADNAGHGHGETWTNNGLYRDGIYQWALKIQFE